MKARKATQDAQYGHNDADRAHAPYRDLLEGLGGIVFEADAQTFQFTYVSPGAEEVLGYPLEYWYDEPDFWLGRVLHPEDRQTVVETVREHARVGRNHEVLYRALRADGHTIWLHGTIRVGRDQQDQGWHLRGFMRDVTEERRTEETLRKSEERLHLALEAAHMGVWDWDVEQGTIYWSDQVYALHGFTKGDLDGSYESYMRVVDRVHPEDADRAQEIIRRALETGEDYDIEYRIRHVDGSSQWLYAKGCIYFNEEGDPLRIAGTVQDITARKRVETELRKLTETLEQRVQERTAALARANEKLRAEIRERIRAKRALERTNTALVRSNRELQDFAYVASHDLQEPLRKITTFADLLHSEYEGTLDESMRFYIERMRSAAQRMRELIFSLLELSRVQTRARSFQEIDLNEVVRNVLVDLDVRIKEAGGVVEVGDLPPIEADPTQMHQLFQNLIGNALKFHREDVPPVVKLHAAVTSSREGSRGRKVYQITVEDNGIGFKEQYVERIFSPLQRLHGRTEYEGIGMGLAICRRIVERHHGTITARSTPGEGSTFIITLPVHQTGHHEDAGDGSGQA